MFSTKYGRPTHNWNRISDVNETKFLGVIIDNTLNWSPHIMHISKNIAKGIGIILKARKVFDNETLFSLYYTFIYPYLNYCIHVWGKAYDTHLHHLIVLQYLSRIYETWDEIWDIPDIFLQPVYDLWVDR